MDKLSNHSTLLLVFFTSILLRLVTFSQEKRPFLNGLFSIQSEGLACNHPQGAWNPSQSDGMASRISVYPPSDGLHSTLRVDSIPQTR